MSKKNKKETELLPENDEEVIDNIEEDDEEVLDDKDICRYTDFGFLGKVKRKSGTYTRLVIVNRWAWMTDNKYRKIYPPVMDILKEKRFKEKDTAIAEVALEKDEIITMLSELNMRHNELLENHAITYFKNAKV